MQKYVILTDSTTDLPAYYAEENGLEVVPLGFMLDGLNYRNYLDNRELPSEEFYKKISEGKQAKTYQVNPEEFYEIFKRILDKGLGILAIIFSSGLSGTFNSARIAYEQIKEENPNAPIKIVDSLCASLGEGLLVHYALEEKRNGMSLDELAKYVEELKLRVSHWFTVMDMDTLKRGGRISASAAFFAKTLNINPVLHVSDEGKLVAKAKKIGRKNALNALVDKFLETYTIDENKVVFISHSNCEKDAIKVMEAIKANTKITDFLINNIGPVIGGHTGVGTVALFYISNKR